MFVHMEKLKEIQKPGREPEIEVDDSVSTGLESRVILYNDDWHTFDEVIAQLIKAVHCSFE